MLHKRTGWSILMVALAMLVTMAQPAMGTDGSGVATDSGVSQGALQDDTPRLELTDKPVEQLAEDLIDCFDIEGENFCLFIGFTDMTPGDARWREVFSTEVERAQANDPGGSLAGYVRWLASLDDAEREQLAEQSLKDGYATVGKVRLYDYVGLDIPIPSGFFDKHPELGIAEGSPQAEALRTAAVTGDPVDMSVFYQPSTEELAEGYEEEVAALVTSTVITRAEAVAFLHSQGVNSPLVLAPEGTDTAEVDGGVIESVPESPTYRYIIYSAYREQERNDFCAPATFQSIDGADDQGYNSQWYWDDYVGWYNSNGTFTGSVYMIRDSINSYTGWDNVAGTYAVTSSAGEGASWYFDVHQINVGIDGAPLVDHVKLYAEWFPYIDENHSGHFQTGRGYSRNSNTISYFEPYDALRWGDPSGVSSGKIQYLNYSNLYGANQEYAWADRNILS